MLEYWNDEPALQAKLAQVQDLIRGTVETAHGFIRPILLSHVESGGKMLRPALALMCSTLGSEDVTADALRIASIVEMIHLASLVHDDIIDSAKTRRGSATIFSQLGAKQAVLAGDYLLAKALTLTSGKERGMNSRVISNALGRLCESELDQDADQGNFFISMHTYSKRISGKTASLFALSCYSGAALTDIDEQMKMKCHRIGYALGMAFQIQDDVLDYVGKASVLGKNTGNDLKCGIPTLPLICALAEEKRLGCKELHSMLENNKPPLNQKTVVKAVSKVQDLGGVAKAAEYVRLYHDRAMKDIDALGNPTVQQQLRSLFEKLSIRSM